MRGNEAAAALAVHSTLPPRRWHIFGHRQAASIGRPPGKRKGERAGGRAVVDCRHPFLGERAAPVCHAFNMLVRHCSCRTRSSSSSSSRCCSHYYNSDGIKIHYLPSTEKHTHELNQNPEIMDHYKIRTHRAHAMRGRAHAHAHTQAHMPMHMPMPTMPCGSRRGATLRRTHTALMRVPLPLRLRGRGVVASWHACACRCVCCVRRATFLSLRARRAAAQTCVRERHAVSEYVPSSAAADSLEMLRCLPRIGYRTTPTPTPMLPCRPQQSPMPQSS